MLGVVGMGLAGGHSRNPLLKHRSHDEASARATPGLNRPADQLHSPPLPCPPCAARRLKRNSRWAEHKAKHTGAAV